MSLHGQANAKWPTVWRTFASGWGLLALATVAAIPLLVLAASTHLALIDDVWDATSSGVHSGGLGHFMWAVWGADSINRFRWSWELEQNLSWFLLGNSLPLHHVWIFMVRGASAFLVYRILVLLLGREAKGSAVLGAVLGFYSPIVPETRLGPVEPLLSLFLLLSLFASTRVVIETQAGKKPYTEVALAALSCLLLAGAKETGVAYVVVIATLLSFVVFTTPTLRTRSLYALLSFMLIVVVSAGWRVYAVMRGGGYATQQAGGWSIAGTTGLGKLVKVVSVYLYAASFRAWLVVLMAAIFVIGVGWMVRNAFRGEARQQCISLLVVGLLLVNAAVMMKIQFVVRYYEPGLWIGCIALGAGVFVINGHLPSRARGLVTLGFGIVFIAAAYPSVFHAFAAQYSARSIEHSTREFISDNIGKREMYLYGNDDASAWDGDRKTEQAYSLEIYLRSYRPMYLGLDSTSLMPIRQFVQRGGTGRWIVGLTHSKHLRDYISPQCDLVEVQRIRGRDVYGLEDKFQAMRRWTLRLRLTNGREDEWVDAGAPLTIGAEAYGWSVWETRCHDALAQPENVVSVASWE